MTIDLEPAARGIADLVTALPEGQLGAPTPCPAYSVGDLVEHIGGLALAFTAAAAKAGGPLVSQAPAPDASRLGPDWRSRIPDDLLTLAKAWRDPAAWTGMTRVGGVDLPGEIAGLVALDEIFIHGWDLAVASGQRFGYDDDSLEVVHGFVRESAAPGQEALRDGIFGPVVEVPPGAPLLDRVIGLTGRNPGWSAG
jgi:uncharacterized protein (TIGR03086 family)